MHALEISVRGLDLNRPTGSNEFDSTTTHKFAPIAPLIRVRIQVEAIKEGRIRKPVVAWVSGTCAKLFKSEVQFGHAGAKSGGLAESAQVV